MEYILLWNGLIMIYMCNWHIAVSADFEMSNSAEVLYNLYLLVRSGRVTVCL